MSPSRIHSSFQLGSSRGPDNSTISYEKGLSSWIGFHRLAINGLDDKSNQPMCIDGCILICNGEIYNFSQLAESEGFDMETRSDCEIITKMFRRYGIEHTLSAIDGVFAFILIDTQDDNKMYVARDPFGVRPLFYMQAPPLDPTFSECCGFASELLPLVSLKLKGKVAPFSPGSYSTYSLSQATGATLLSSKQYYRLPSTNSGLLPNISMYFGLITQSLYEAVQKRVLNSDRPVCCLLSGGLDSSTVAAFTCKVKGDPSLVRTYSIGLSGSVDLANARVVADHLGTTHEEFIVSEEEFLDAIPEVIAKIGSYDTTTVRASVGNYLIGKYIAQKGDIVVLNGDGADEVMGGYLYMRKAPTAQEFDRECRRLITDIHYFDVLRSDRCISSHGLEPRTPFLDKTFVQTYLSIPAALRFKTTAVQQEKYLLRAALSVVCPDLLPASVITRKKEAFSDGVSSEKKAWFEIIGDKVRDSGLDKSVDGGTYGRDINLPQTAEQRYYRSIFDSIYPNCAGTIPYMWMPKFVDASDASARTLDIYGE